MVPSALMRNIFPSRLERVCAVGVFPYANVELAVRAEMGGAAIVVGGRAKVVEFQDNGFAARCRSVAGRGKPADPIVDWRRRNGVINVEVVIGGEVRIERDPKKAAFAGGIDSEGHEWRAEQHAVFDHAQLATLLADKKPSIRRKRHRCW